MKPSKHRFRGRFAALATALALALAAWPAYAQTVGGHPVTSLRNPYTGKMQQAAADQILVKFRPGVSQADIQAVHSRQGGKQVGALRLAAIQLVAVPSGADPEALAKKYRADPQVEAAGPDWVMRLTGLPNDPYFGLQWGMSKIQAPAAWDIASGTPSVVIAAVDSGLDLDHPEFTAAGKVWTNPGEIPGNGIDDDGDGYVDDVHGWDFTRSVGDPRPVPDGADNNGDGYPDENVNHGTHVAGIIAATTNNGIGVAGVAPGCAVLPVKVFPDDGGQLTSVIMSGAIYAADRGAKVINLSIGGGYDPMWDIALNYLFSTKRAVVVAAAGNTSEDVTGQVISPAGNDGSSGNNRVLGVTSTGQNDVRAYYSNYSSDTVVDVSAPGGDGYNPMPGGSSESGEIYSTYFRGAPAIGFADPYGYMQGTSMAAPHVAGLAGLLFSQNPSFTPEAVVARIRATTDSIDAVNPSYAGLLGTGRINTLRAVGVGLGSILVVQGRNLAPVAVNAGAVDEAMLRVSLTLDTGSTTLTGMKVKLTGASTTDAHITRVQMYLDSNGNSLPEPGEELSSPTTFSARIATFSGLSLAVSDTTTRQLLVVYDFAPSIPLGTLIGAELTDSTYLTTSTSVLVTGLPISSALTRIGKNQLLLVADDEASGYETYYQAALTTAGYTYDTYTVLPGNDGPAYNQLKEYLGAPRGVLWLTANAYSQTLTAADQTALAAFLDSGGRLFLSGQDIGWDLVERDHGRAFYEGYLRAAYVQDDPGIRGLRGVPGDPISDGQTLLLGSLDAATYTYYPSEINALSPAVAIFFYDSSITGSSGSSGQDGKGGSRKSGRGGLTGILGSGAGALRVENGGSDSKMVYFAFGLEGVGGANTRALLVSRTVSWMLSPVSSAGPLPPTNLSADLNPDISAAVDLTWTASTDPSAAGYVVYFRPVGGTFGLPSDAGNATSFTVTGLTPGTTYQFAVAAYKTGRVEGPRSAMVSATPLALEKRPYGRGFNLISVPVNLAAGRDTPQYVFGLPQSAPVYLFAWDPATQTFVNYPDSRATYLTVGQGYWFYATDPGTMKAQGLVAYETGSYTATLAAGWNLIGDPFDFTVAWDPTVFRVRVGTTEKTLARAHTDGDVEDYAWTYVSGHFVPVVSGASPLFLHSLEPLRGYYIYAYRAVELIIPGLPGGTAMPGRSPWESVTGFRLTAANAQGTDDITLALGDATTGVRLLLDPPAPGRAVDVAIVGQDGRAIPPCAAAVSAFTGAPITWAIEVRTTGPAGPVSLDWSDLRPLPRDVSLVLKDLDGGVTRAMRTTPGYTFQAREGTDVRHLQVILRRGAPAGSLAISELSASPGRGAQLISFRLSQASRVTASVITLTGQPVARLGEGTFFPGGVSQFTWDLRNGSGTQVPPGMYLVQLTAENDVGERFSAMRPLVVPQ